jgi:hypothetical protein
VEIGGGSGTGDLFLKNAAEKDTIVLRAAEGENAGAWIGGKEQTGWITVRNKDDQDVLTTGGEDGLLELRDAGAKTMVRLKTEAGGLVELCDTSGKTMIQLKAATAAARLGGRGVDGDVLVFSAAATSQDTAQAAVWIKGSSGDIVLKNADCAEEFDVVTDIEVEPAMVMVINAGGTLRPCLLPYDRTVAGIVSGSGKTHPGIILGHQADGRRVAIALAGRVECLVDASYASIDIGDLLTTSATPGHAMKVTDVNKAFGAVIGKALAAQRAGRGTIPVLVAPH